MGYSKLNHFIFIFIVTVLFLIQYSIGSPLENDKLAELTERFDRMQTKIDAQELEIEKLRLQKYKQDEEMIQLKVKITKLESLVPTESVSKQESNSPAYRKSDVATPRASTPPSSCEEMTGHAKLAEMDGIYLVQNKDTKKVEAVFCQFSTTPISQDLIGHVNPQKKTVHFYVRRMTPFKLVNTVIPFENALLNEGDAFDLPSGTFTVPIKGIYHFQFSAVKDLAALYLEVFLQVNGLTVGHAFGYNDNYSSSNNNVVAMTASLALSVNDKVTLLNKGTSVLYDDSEHMTHFVGWLVEEDLK